MKLWIVTEEINAYNQEGEYFVAAFVKKPTFKDLKALGISNSDATIGKLTRGGGREAYEDVWYDLHEVESGQIFGQ